MWGNKSRLMKIILNRPTQRIYRHAVMVLVVHILGGAPFAWADGFRNPQQGTKAIGQGLAFIAQADDPSAIHFNPAGLVQLPGVHLSLGTQFIHTQTEFRSTGGIHIENDAGTVGIPPPAQIFLTAQLPLPANWLVRNLTFGLGMESLYGFANTYPKNGPFAGVVTEAQLPLLDIKPTMAFRLNDYIAIGLGADIFTFVSFLGEGQVEQRSIALGNIPGTTAGDELELNGKGTTAGMNASVLLTLLFNDHKQPLINVGFIWRSQAVLPLKGELLANGAFVANSSFSLRFPESYEFGLAVWPIRNHKLDWKVEVDLHYVRWQSLRNFDVTLSNGAVPPQPQRWDNAITIGAGTELNWLSPWQLTDWEIATRVGYTFSEKAVSDFSFNPSYTDANAHSISFGLGFICQGQAKFLGLIACGTTSQHAWLPTSFTVDLAYQIVFWESRTVTQSPFPGLNGRYDFRTHIGGITLSLGF